MSKSTKTKAIDSLIYRMSTVNEVRVDDKLNGILDRFSKLHPFADTPTYNVYHGQAIQATKELIVEARIHEIELMQHQARVNLKTAEAVADWGDIRIAQLKETIR